MYCPKCGKQNDDYAQVCSWCSWVLSDNTGNQAAVAVNQESQTSGLAIASLVLGILSIPCFIIAAIPAIICGIIALVKINSSNGRLKGNGMAITGIVLPAVLFFLVPLGLALLMPALSKVKIVAQRIECSTNMKELCMAIAVYANDYDDKFPTADKWCDLLVAEADVDPKIFRCPMMPENHYSYAFNKNLEGLRLGALPPDVVMLFEADAGPNASDGPELLIKNRHPSSTGIGYNIAFTDGHIEFIDSENIRTLKWKVE